MSAKKGQSGVEYMAVVGIALLVLTAGTMILSNYSRSMNDQVVSNKINIIGRTMINNAESMYVLGNESWITVEFNFPTSVKSTMINDQQDLVFTYYTATGTSDIVFFLDKFNISNQSARCTDGSCVLDITPGVNRIKIRSGGNYVSMIKMP
jgi:hypothetical protein